MNIIKHPETFSHGIRVLLLKGRYKDGLQIQRTEYRITENPDEYQKSLDLLVRISEPGERIYTTANQRSIKTASMKFRQRQLDVEFGNATQSFYARLFDRWISALMKSPVKSPRFWMFDCDEAWQVDLAYSSITPDSVYTYQTKNGSHMIFPAQDSSKFSQEAKSMLHKDPLMLVGY